MRIAITGATGLVGNALTRYLAERGDTVLSVVRRAVEPPRSPEHEILWNPAEGRIDAARLAGVDAIVNLAGENIAAGRWTEARKRSIRESRVSSASLIARTAAAVSPRPRVLVSASAVGYYGARDETPLAESAPAGEGFLPDVCRAWEAAVHPAGEAGIRVVILRIGMVLTPRGGALEKMLPLFRLGMGGVVGSGRQYMSWIGLTDLLRVICFAIDQNTLHGPVNAVAPQAVTNREFTQTLGRVLSRPTVLPAPAFAIRAALGEMGDALLLTGANVIPERLLAAGFEFSHPELEDALRHELDSAR